MASSITDSVGVKANSCSDSSQKVRIVAKIRASTDLEIEASNGSLTPWVLVQKPDGESSKCVTISFGDQATSRKDSYKLDYCYEQDEDVNQIFSREVKPLLRGVFHGLNASILAYGARGSGKTYIIQGSDEKPGLAPLAMAEILSMGADIGSSVTVSCYEVYQDHVYDLLEPKGKEVSVMEDARGRIQLKGLSQVPVKSISEFYKFYFHGCSSRKPAQKVTNEHRSHKGLIIHVSCNNKDSDTRLVGKMNFVDLAGYEDTKRKSIDGSNLSESAWIHKSLYTLQNVVKALNTNERVPYRESKLTRMLQDSFGGTSQTLMVTCLNPSFCQDTIYTVSLASRSFQDVNQVCHDSTKKTKGAARFMPFHSPKVGGPQSLSTSVKKHNGSQLRVIERKAHGVPSAMKGRKLFDGAKPIVNSVQEKSLPDVASAIEPSLPKEEDNSSDVTLAIKPFSMSEEEISLSTTAKEIEPSIPKEDVSPDNEHNHPKVTTRTECDAKSSIVAEEDNYMEKENNSLVNESGSPPLSARLRELSNSLKSLCSSTPLKIEMPQKGNSCHDQVCIDLMEPKTPGVERNVGFNDNWDKASFCSPRETFSERSSGIKQSLVREYLKFLNTATKEELKGLKGIKEKRANYILELREESPEPFKNLDDLKDIGLSTKQINGMMKKVAGELFS